MRQQLLSIFFLLFTFSSIAQDETTVYFEFDDYGLTKDAMSALDSIVVNESINSVEIYGHCDQLGSREYNYKLSEQRANAVRDYLIDKGFNSAKINMIKGFGKDDPVVDKMDPESRKANRRVTIVKAYKPVAAKPVIPKEMKPLDTIAATDKPTAARVQRKEKLVDEIRDTSTKVGENLVLKNINFYGGTHRFLPRSYPVLEELLEAMEKIPTLKIEIHGHICCRDDPGDGMDNDTGEPFLSFNRARAVYHFLIRNGIDKSRMTYKGFGHRYPIYKDEISEEEKTINRRVEIKIISK